MRLPVAPLALAATLAAAAPAAAQQPPAPPAAPQPAAAPPAAAPAPWGYAPPYAGQPYAVPAGQPYAVPAGQPYAGQPYAMPYGAPYRGPWMPMPAPVTERRSSGMMISGIVLWGASGVATVVGTLMFFSALGSACAVDFASAAPRSLGAAVGTARRERIGTAQQAWGGCGADPTPGFAIMTAGVIGSVVAIPIFVVGNSRVPARPHGDAAAVPELRLGAGNAELRWQF